MNNKRIYALTDEQVEVIDGWALREAARAQLEHMERTGWAYTKRTAQKLTGSHWTYYHGENVAVEIYDK